MHRVPKASAVPRRYYRPERRLCPTCGALLKRHHVLWRKTLVLLAGQVQVTSWGYRCSNPSCAAQAELHRSVAAEQLHLGRRQFSREVVTQVGYWRFWQHLTVQEIHERLVQDRQLPVSLRAVLDLLGDFLALVRAAQPAKIAAAQSRWAALGGLIIGIDGMQPEKGNQCLYVVRELQLGLTLLAVNLDDSSAAELTRQLLAPLQELAHQLQQPLLGIVSDAQESIQLAVQSALPGVPHQCCQYHCLRDAGSLTFQVDRTMKTALKKAIRDPLNRLQSSLTRLPVDDPWRAILTDYAGAVRATLLEGGVAPFELGGIRVFDDLTAIAASLRRCQEKRGIRSWSAYCA